MDTRNPVATGFQEMADPSGYLARLAKPLQAKLAIAKYIPKSARNVLDVGCADGIVTCALAQMFPEKQFVGIDLNEDFIAAARKRGEHLPNVSFEKIYLRELLAREERFDVVQFCTVLHEFFTYGEGISSVLKAVADAHEMLRRQGVVLIRDMILYEYTKQADFRVDQLRAQLEAHLEPYVIADFRRHFGPLDNVHAVNHLMLKYLYTDNWERECPEHYVPVTVEQYQRIFELLGMRTEYTDSMTLPYLHRRWMRDFKLRPTQIEHLRSTTFMVAKRV